MTRYLQDRKERLEDEMITNYAVFGQLGGLIVSLLGFMKWLTTYNAVASNILLASLIFSPLACNLYVTFVSFLHPLNIADTFSAMLNEL